MLGAQQPTLHFFAPKPWGGVLGYPKSVTYLHVCKEEKGLQKHFDLKPTENISEAILEFLVTENVIFKGFWRFQEIQMCSKLHIFNLFSEKEYFTRMIFLKYLFKNIFCANFCIFLASPDLLWLKILLLRDFVGGRGSKHPPCPIIYHFRHFPL